MNSGDATTCFSMIVQNSSIVNDDLSLKNRSDIDVNNGINIRGNEADISAVLRVLPILP
jgi:hypothetical protein